MIYLLLYLAIGFGYWLGFVSMRLDSPQNFEPYPTRIWIKAGVSGILAWPILFVLFATGVFNDRT